MLPSRGLSKLIIEGRERCSGCGAGVVGADHHVGLLRVLLRPHRVHITHAAAVLAPRCRHHLLLHDPRRICGHPSIHLGEQEAEYALSVLPVEVVEVDLLGVGLLPGVLTCTKLRAGADLAVLRTAGTTTHHGRAHRSLCLSL